MTAKIFWRRQSFLEDSGSSHYKPILSLFYRPGQILAVYDNLKQDKTKRDFTIGIVDDVAFTSLPVTREIKTAPAGQTSAEFWACHIPSYARQYDMVSNLKQGGIFLLNCSWAPADLERELPASMKRALAVKEARLYAIDATRIARGLGLGGRTNTILQAA